MIQYLKVPHKNTFQFPNVFALSLSLSLSLKFLIYTRASCFIHIPILIFDDSKFYMINPYQEAYITSISSNEETKHIIQEIEGSGQKGMETREYM